jgi:hypothetical protein
VKVQTKIPVGACKFPVTRIVFPVSSHRELLEKWLRTAISWSETVFQSLGITNFPVKFPVGTESLGDWFERRFVPILDRVVRQF